MKTQKTMLKTDKDFLSLYQYGFNANKKEQIQRKRATDQKGDRTDDSTGGNVKDMDFQHKTGSPISSGIKEEALQGDPDLGAGWGTNQELLLDSVLLSL